MARTQKKALKDQAIWTVADESALIDFLSQHCAEARDGLNFKAATWRAAVDHLSTVTTKGGVKDVPSITGKCTQVSIF